MAQISIIKRKDILEAGRLDAEYFKPEYLETEGRLKDGISLKDVSELIVCGPFGSTILDETYTETGVEVIRPFNIKNGSVADDNVVYISESDVKKKNLKMFTEGDLFFARVGDIRVGVLTRKEVTISPNIVAVKLNKGKSNPYFLSVFLNTKYGLSQLLREQKVVAQPTISTNAVNNLRIPSFPQLFQKRIEKDVKDVHKKQEKAKRLCREAEEVLLKELDLVGYESKHTLSFEAKKKDVENVERFDAEYFQPKYEDIIEKIEGYNGRFDVVKNMVEWKKGVEVGSEEYTEEGKDFVRVSDFSVHGVENVNKKISEDLFKNLKDYFQPEKGEILFTKDGTVGMSHVLKEEIDGVLSGAFLRVSFKKEYEKMNEECLSLIFNSIICQVQIEQLSGGAIIKHLKPSDFEKLKIPLIKEGSQKQIDEKMRESHELRKESKDLLESAKEKVEAEIEKA